MKPLGGQAGLHPVLDTVAVLADVAVAELLEPGGHCLAVTAETVLTAYQDFLDVHLDLVQMSETASPGARYRIGAYRFWHQHVAVLLKAARPDLDADYLAHALLSVLAADTHAALREHTDGERVRGGVHALAALMLTGVATLPHS